MFPELQSRGALRKEYEDTTLWEYYFGTGERRIAADHPAAAFRIASPPGAER